MYLKEQKQKYKQDPFPTPFPDTLSLNPIKLWTLRGRQPFTQRIELATVSGKKLRTRFAYDGFEDDSNRYMDRVGMLMGGGIEDVGKIAMGMGGGCM
jgi:hypothetical protein